MRPGKSAAVHFVSQVVVSVAGFVATLLIARLLGAALFGEYKIAVGLVYWIAVPAMGIGSAITKRVSEGDRPDSHFSAGVILNVALVVVVAVVLVTFGDAINGYVGAEVASLVAVLVAVTVAFYSVLDGLTGEQRIAEAGALKAFERVLRTGGQIALILVGWQVSGLVVGHIGSMVVATLLSLLVSDLSVSLPERRDVVRVVDYARYSWMGTIESRVFGWMDTLVLAFFVSSTLVGVYEVAWTLSSFLGIASASIRTTLFPKLSELDAVGDHERVRHFLEEGLAFTGILIFPGLAGVAVIGPRILRIYGSEFPQGTAILLMLVLAQIVKAYKMQFLGVINAVDRPDVAFRVNVAFVVSNLALNVSLISQYGWYGAAVATTVSTAVSLVIGYYYANRLVGTPSFPVVEVGKQVVASVVMAGVVHAATGLVPGSQYATVALVALGAGTYLTVLLAISTRVRRKAWSLLPPSVTARMG